MEHENFLGVVIVALGFAIGLNFYKMKNKFKNYIYEKGKTIEVYVAEQKIWLQKVLKEYIERKDFVYEKMDPQVFEEYIADQKTWLAFLMEKSQKIEKKQLERSKEKIVDTIVKNFDKKFEKIEKFMAYKKSK